jgi:hypothetical protein
MTRLQSLLCTSAAFWGVSVPATAAMVAGGSVSVGSVHNSNCIASMSGDGATVGSTGVGCPGTDTCNWTWNNNAQLNPGSSDIEGACTVTAVGVNGYSGATTGKTPGNPQVGALISLQAPNPSLPVGTENSYVTLAQCEQFATQCMNMTSPNVIEPELETGWVVRFEQ